MTATSTLCDLCCVTVTQSALDNFLSRSLAAPVTLQTLAARTGGFLTRTIRVQRGCS